MGLERWHEFPRITSVNKLKNSGFRVGVVYWLLAGALESDCLSSSPNPTTYCVMLGKSFYFSKPWFPPQWNAHKSNIYLSAVYIKWNNACYLQASATWFLSYLWILDLSAAPAFSVSDEILTYFSSLEMKTWKSPLILCFSKKQKWKFPNYWKIITNHNSN